MVTMGLLPQPSNCPLQQQQLQGDEQSITRLLEPYDVVSTSSSLIEYFTRKEAAPKRKEHPIAESVMRCVCWFELGSWTKLAWSGVTWTLLMCLLLARGRTDLRLVGDHDPSSSSTGAVHGPRGALSSLRLDGVLTFANLSSAASDFGRIRFAMPSAILYPRSVRDVQVTVRAVHSAPVGAGLTMAAKGRAHSVHGQAQALNGVVVEMSTLKAIRVAPQGEPGCPQPFVDAAGGEVWIDVLKATMAFGLAPRSWTDYLNLSIGGTLSNAGIGGQTFRFGPEISNVLQLDVVTGTGRWVQCSPTKHPDLFYGVLGGLGQFGIITSARILLEPAHEKVRWIRVMYTDFAAFTKDQETLVSQPQEAAFDYIEGFVVLNNEDVHNGWNSVPFDGKKIDAAAIPEEGGSILYYIELVKKFSCSDTGSLNETMESMLAPLSFIPTLKFTTDVPYTKFLNRLHDVEVDLASQGLWDVPHPWLNLFVPRSSIASFDALIFKHMIKSDFSGPILIYPLKSERWDVRSSAVIPDETIFYLVAFLRISLPSSGTPLTSLIAENDKIMELCHTAALGCKMYLPEHEDPESWKLHFGKQRWDVFVRRKHQYDPRFILATGQNIFPRTLPIPALTATVA